MIDKTTTDYSLYLCTDRNCIQDRDFYQIVEQAVQGGCTLVQLREKNFSTREFIQEAKGIKAITDKYNIPLIINDRVDICLAVNAAGVHLGQEDMPVSDARRLLGSEKIIGCSAHNINEALLAEQEGADYLGVGAIFTTATKKDTVATSIQTLGEICEKVKIPVVAIGGLKEENVKELTGTNISGIAVVSAIMAAKEPKKEAQHLQTIVKDIVKCY